MGDRANRPRVLIDARMVGPVPHGFSRYVERIAEGLSALDARQNELPYEPVFIVAEGFPEADFKGFEIVRAKSAFLSSEELAELPWILFKEQASLYHSPSFSSLLTAPCPWVVTVHDLNHLSFGDAKRKLYYRFLLRSFIRRAKRLMTVSRFSAAELAGWLGSDEEKITLVYNALTAEFSRAPQPAEVEQVLARYGLVHGQYFFCLSNLKPHKNLARLFEAYRDYRTQARSPGAKSGEPWPLVLNLKPAHPPAGLLSLGALNDAEVRALLAGAGAAVFPSLYEGFGLAPVEAAILGAPLLVSKIPSHEEGLADLLAEEVSWVDPESIPDWSEAMRRAEQGELRPVSALSREKLRQRFSTDRMGQDMDRVYRDVLDSE